MRIIENASGTEYQGDPGEIAEYMLIRNRSEATIEDPNLPINPYAPFEEVLTESEELRKKLAADPNYNPHGGVVPSKESEDIAAVNLPTAEKDTGVEYI